MLCDLCWQHIVRQCVLAHAIPEPHPMICHSKQMRRRHECGGNLNRKTTCCQLTRQTEQSLKWKPEVQHLQTFDAKQVFHDLLSACRDNTLEDFNPLAFHALLNDTSTPTYQEGVAGPDREGFWKAMLKEI